jgi:ATP-dependent DNA helicase PIF1
VTLHSLATTGVPREIDVFEKIHTKKKFNHWDDIDVLVLDEVSMINPTCLDNLDYSVRNKRKNLVAAFGGIQLIFCGDFMQLGPIPNRFVSTTANVQQIPKLPMDVKECSALAFQSVCWHEANFNVFELDAVFRQKSLQFIEALSMLRWGNGFHPTVKNLVRRCSRPLSVGNGVKPTLLFCKNIDVEKMNHDELEALPGLGASVCVKD